MFRIHRFIRLTFLLQLTGTMLAAQPLFFAGKGTNAMVPYTGQRVILPQQFHTLEADWVRLKDFLFTLPDESRPGFNRVQAPEFSLPMPDGNTSRFRVWESSIQEPALQEKFPGIRTYLGQGLDDPAATVRFDIGPRGFHAQVLSPRGTYYIDPFAVGDTRYYMVYYKADLQRTGSMQCELTGRSLAERTEAVQAACLGTQLRTYRLAVACTGEYAQAPGINAGSDPAILHNAIVTTVNRVVGVYEQEVAVRLVLVANNNLVEFLNAATDPFTGNNNANTLIGESQTVITANIGTANFDIGHTFSTGGGGLAFLGCVCSSTTKARGITGRSTPTGDAFDIDYVAHEMGHQFDGDHTFNSITSSCGGGNRNASTAYEVGSGTTIQAYAGICGSDNIQPNSDPFFHAISFDQVSNFVTGTGCAVLTNTGNTLPVIAPLPNNNLTIPVSTPFTLTGTATDTDGDALTYCWEEWDTGTAGAWNSGAGSTTAPLFKSRVPKTSGIRTFPDMAVILAGYPASPAATLGGLKGETLATVARPMKFRLTVRDNRAGGGGVVSAGSGCQSATVFTVNTSGSTPFTVTAPNGGESFPGGTQQSVTWNTAGTAAAPFNTSNVKISLSTDGGLTFPDVLLASTPNDGSEIVVMPVLLTSTARIKVEAVENIFFDISNANFSITAAPSCNLTCPANITVPNSPGQCGAIVSFPAPVTSGTCGTVSVSPASGTFFPVGTTLVTVTTTAGPSCQFSVTVQDTEAPQLSCPSNISVNNDPGQCGAIVNFALPSATDNCGGATVTANPAPGSFFPVGTTTVTVTASDTSPNSPDATCTFTVTVLDIQAPVLNCPSPITVNNTSGQCGAIVNFALPAASDNCTSVTVIANPAPGSFFPVGSTTVTLTASDTSPNSPDATCTFTVTVLDTQAPVVSCPTPLTVNNTAGQCGAVVNFALPAATDNCGGATVTASPASGSFFPVGTTTVTVTAADTSPNSPDATCTFTVTVKDTEPPVVSCPPAINVSTSPGLCGAVVNFALPTASDNCGTAAVSASPAPGTIFPVGTTAVTITATDNSPDSPDATCVFNVVVTSSVNGSISGTTTVEQNASTSSPVTFSAGSGTPDYTFSYSVNGGAPQTVSSTGGSNTATVMQSNAVAGVYTYTLLSITDALGCPGIVSGPASVTITVTSPTCTFSCPASITVAAAAGQCGAVVNYPAISAPPGCGTITSTPASGSFFPVGATTVTVSAASGFTCTFTVTVLDTEAPGIFCPLALTFASDPGQCGATVSFSLPAASDNCTASPLVTASPASGSFFPIGTTFVTLTAADASPDSPDASCTFPVIITNSRSAGISGTATVAQNPGGNSVISFTGSGGTADYTFFYSINSGPVQVLSTSGGSNVATVQQSHAVAGSYTYTLLSMTDAIGCSGVISGSGTATVTVTGAGPDLTNSQFFTTTQLAGGGMIEEVISVRNVGLGPTTAPVVLTVTNYAGITGLSVIPNPDPSVTIGFTSYPLNNSNWTTSSTPSALTFTSNPGLVIAPGTSVFLGVRILRAAGANGTVTHSVTIAAGTGGGDAVLINNSISNTLLKN